MKSFTLSLLMTGSILALNAQTAVQDSVEMGAGYANEVYYKLSDGQKSATPANNYTPERCQFQFCVHELECKRRNIPSLD